jgi:hypothetical protein
MGRGHASGGHFLEMMLTSGGSSTWKLRSCSWYIFCISAAADMKTELSLLLALVLQIL